SISRFSDVPLLSFFFLFYCPGAPRALHSFPTRRSSDLHGSAYLGHCSVPLCRAGRTARQVYARQPWLAVRRSDHRDDRARTPFPDRKSTRLNSSHVKISYAVFCLKKKSNVYTTYASFCM